MSGDPPRSGATVVRVYQVEGGLPPADSRHRDGPEWFSADYEGKLLGDCWHGFEAIAVSSEGRIERAACNAHAWRAYPEDRKR